jgi:hypothetical protein
MAPLLINIEKLESAANKLRAISHPMRIAIFDLLTQDKAKRYRNLRKTQNPNSL